MVDRFEYEKDRECIVGGCINRSDEGKFNGPICTACESWLKVKDAADKFRTHGYRCPKCGQVDDIDNIGDGERCHCPKCDIDWKAPAQWNPKRANKPEDDMNRRAIDLVRATLAARGIDPQQIDEAVNLLVQRDEGECQQMEALRDLLEAHETEE